MSNVCRASTQHVCHKESNLLLYDLGTEATLTQNCCLLFLESHLMNKQSEGNRTSPCQSQAKSQGSWSTLEARPEGRAGPHALECVHLERGPGQPPLTALPELTASCLHMACQLGQARQLPAHSQSRLAGCRQQAMARGCRCVSPDSRHPVPCPNRVGTHVEVASGQLS